MKKLFASFLAAFLMISGAHAAGGGFPLDTFPKERVTDQAALQNGARLFVNYCLNCHAASFMRYNRMQDIGLTDGQIRENLLFAGEKVGDLMTVSLRPRDAKEWFGATPPDLTLVARSRASGAGSGGDYLYTYLRTFYQDDTRPTGWNNMVFSNVGMPHVLWELQGTRKANFDAQHAFKGFEQVTPGKLSPQEFDSAMADLTAYMVWMAEPVAQTRMRIGVGVMIFLLAFFFIAWRLNAAYWKDVK